MVTTPSATSEPAPDCTDAAEAETSDAALRPKSVKGMGNKYADAKSEKKCCKSFKHMASIQ